MHSGKTSLPLRGWHCFTLCGIGSKVFDSPGFRHESLARLLGLLGIDRGSNEAQGKGERGTKHGYHLVSVSREG